jgi:flagellar biosynthesis/type III secretory pathway protein FliH
MSEDLWREIAFLIDKIREKAYADGYNDGSEAGFNEGYDRALDETGH